MIKYTNLIFQKLESWKTSAAGSHCFKCGKRFQGGDDWWDATTVFRYDWQENIDVYLCCDCAGIINLAKKETLEEVA